MAGFQVKIVLEGATPPLWRRVLLPEQLSFADLHKILQIVFGWEEEHLHEFSFQHSRVIVSDTEYMDEKEIAADEYLRDGWIRYTYDFRDGWEHKITLEKEVGDYDNRYPTVIKHKRNNMEEDSGGVWGGEECENPYDEAVVNSLLEAKCVCKPLVSKGFQKKKEFQKEFQKQKEMDELLKELFKKLKISQKRHSTKKKSDLDRKLDKISSFYEACGIESSDIPIELLNEEQSSEEGQLVFNFETGQTDVEPDLPDFTICKSESDITQEELLVQGAESLIFDYAKYLMIPKNENRGKKRQ